MRPRRPTPRKPASLDPRLIGTWAGDGDRFTIGADGWSLSPDQYPATISPNGQTLTIGETVYTRVLGSGPTIQGVWQWSEVNDEITDLEDWYLRSDGTYASQWTQNGVFHSVYFGQYTYAGGIMSTQERRELVTNGPGNAIHLDVPYGDDATGTYSLPSPNTLVWTIDGVTRTFDRK